MRNAQKIIRRLARRGRDGYGAAVVVALAVAAPDGMAPVVYLAAIVGAGLVYTVAHHPARLFLLFIQARVVTRYLQTADSPEELLEIMRELQRSHKLLTAAEPRRSRKG